MAKHEWKRAVRITDRGVEYEYAETSDLNPPEPDAGWRLASAFGVGRVSGAGDSPSRSSR